MQEREKAGAAEARVQDKEENQEEKGDLDEDKTFQHRSPGIINLDHPVILLRQGLKGEIRRRPGEGAARKTGGGLDLKGGKESRRQVGKGNNPGLPGTGRIKQSPLKTRPGGQDRGQCITLVHRIPGGIGSNDKKHRPLQINRGQKRP